MVHKAMGREFTLDQDFIEKVGVDPVLWRKLRRDYLIGLVHNGYGLDMQELLRKNLVDVSEIAKGRCIGIATRCFFYEGFREFAKSNRLSIDIPPFREVVWSLGNSAYIHQIVKSINKKSGKIAYKVQYYHFNQWCDVWSPGLFFDVEVDFVSVPGTAIIGVDANSGCASYYKLYGLLEDKIYMPESEKKVWELFKDFCVSENRAEMIAGACLRASDMYHYIVTSAMKNKQMKFEDIMKFSALPLRDNYGRTCIAVGSLKMFCNDVPKYHLDHNDTQPERHVKGHIRTYKSGKQVYIEPYTVKVKTPRKNNTKN